MQSRLDRMTVVRVWPLKWLFEHSILAKFLLSIARNHRVSVQRIAIRTMKIEYIYSSRMYLCVNMNIFYVRVNDWVMPMKFL